MFSENCFYLFVFRIFVCLSNYTYLRKNMYFYSRIDVSLSTLFINFLEISFLTFYCLTYFIMTLTRTAARKERVIRTVKIIWASSVLIWKQYLTTKYIHFLTLSWHTHTVWERGNKKGGKGNCVTQGRAGSETVGDSSMFTSIISCRFRWKRRPK